METPECLEGRDPVARRIRELELALANSNRTNEELMVEVGRNETQKTSSMIRDMMRDTANDKGGGSAKKSAKKRLQSVVEDRRQKNKERR